MKLQQRSDFFHTLHVKILKKVTMQHLSRVSTLQLVAVTHTTIKSWQVPRVLMQTRCLATVPVGDVLFPSKSDFPSRHIGPRKTDVVAMLDTLGFKVRTYVHICLYRYIKHTHIHTYRVSEEQK